MTFLVTIVSSFAPLLSEAPYHQLSDASADPSPIQSHPIASNVLHRSDPRHQSHAYLGRLLVRYTLDHAYSLNIEDILLARGSLRYRTSDTSHDYGSRPVSASEGGFG